MTSDITALKREKINREVSAGIAQTKGETLQRHKSGGKGSHSTPSKSMPLEKKGK
jgi:hypothetical protein